MDRAWIVRLSFRCLILGAIAIQAAMPDLLEFSLISHTLPPDALLVTSSVLPNLKARSHQGLLPVSETLSAEFSSGEEAPESLSLCKPIWPKLGLRLDRAGNEAARPRPVVHEPLARFTVWLGPVAASSAFGLAATHVKAEIPFRLLC